MDETSQRKAPQSALVRVGLCIVGWFALGVWQALPAQPADQTKWTATGNLAAARVCCTSALLPDGRVLVAGGYGGSGELSSTELYDPKEGVFIHAPDLLQARSNHTETPLSNGQILVVGGQANGSTLASAELYNPSTGAWTQTGSLHIARSYHTATLLSDGEVLVTGGIHWASPPVFAQGAPPDSALDVAELYDPSTGQWTVTDSMHTPRYTHTSTLLVNGDVLVTGGIGPRGTVRGIPRTDTRAGEDYYAELQKQPGHVSTDVGTSAEIFNHKTKAWTITGNLLNPRFNHTATLLPDGQVLVSGGQTNGNIWETAELYNVSTGAWTLTGPLQTSRNGHTATLLPDGRVLVAGGANNSGVLTSVEIYNPSTKRWAQAGTMNAPHALDTAALLANGKVLVAGGCYALGMPTYTSASAELFEVVPPIAEAGSTDAPRANSSTLTFVPSAPLSFAAYTGNLLVFTVCIVILTACAVVLLAALAVFMILRRWAK